MVGVSDGEPRAVRPTPAAGTPVDRPLLSRELTAVMDEVRAHSGAVYLLVPGEPVLEMTVMAGLPRAFAAPWERVGLNAPVPVADAVRERRLVWVGGDQDMARRYPRVALVLPYPFMLAALPVATERAVYGAVFLTWPAAHAPDLSEHERERLTAACARMARGLERALRRDRRPPREADPSAASPPDGPGAAASPPDGAPDAADTADTAEAARMVSRLPYGLVSLDLDGRVAYANQAAADLMDTSADALPGIELWSAVPWLDDPVHEDRYRAALVSQRVTSFTALRPPGERLSFRLYPSYTGLTVRIDHARSAPAPDEHGPDEHGPDEHGPGPGVGLSRLVTISQVLSLTEALTRAVGVRDVLRLVADDIAPAVGCRGVVLLASRAGRLHVLGHHGYADPRTVEQFDGMQVITRAPNGRALVGGEPAFFETPEELVRACPPARAGLGEFSAWAYLPLITSGRPVGTCVLAYLRPRRFSGEERAVLTSLAGLVAQALERAQLYDATHRVAHGLQGALLPHSLPQLPGIEAAARYLPAAQDMDIGGDFYDLAPARPLPAAMIGDVQGHNVTAAGLMGQLRTAVRAYCSAGQSPREVMSSTNRLLIELGTELFASCLYLRLDTAHEEAMVARAGHPPPLLRDPDGRARVLEPAGGPLLGIDPEATYPQTGIGLGPGTVLVLYTDGLVEASDVDLDDALAGLVRCLHEAGDVPLEELADRLLARSDAARRRADDIALLLLRAR
ncbi:SpoIIE family protein phosphatase [Streptomyces echinoruber]|uniref:SpoIIE family protein phosphatase n=1 Tax=Streptomyces echinoruber TaxID=68898 RepID=UPI001E2F3698|nr:SpoIIE family protein phosphatase [Streptomyces echinoruber]